MVMRTLPAVLAAAAVACLLLAGAGVYHARSASRLLAGPAAGNAMKPWEDPDSEAAAFITGSPAVQPALAAMRGREHAGSESEAEEGTAAVTPPRVPRAGRGMHTGDGDRRGGAGLYARIKGEAEAHERVRRLDSVKQQARAILAKIAAANGGVQPVADLSATCTAPGGCNTPAAAHQSRTWLVDSSTGAAAHASDTRDTHYLGNVLPRSNYAAGAPSPVFAVNTASIGAGASRAGGPDTSGVHLQNLRSADAVRWGHPVPADDSDTEDADANEAMADVSPESEGITVAGNGAGGAAVQRLRSAIQGPSGIAALGETADEAYGGTDGPNVNGNPNAGSWIGGQYHPGKDGADNEMSDAPWEFHGEDGQSYRNGQSYPSQMDTSPPHPGQVPDLLADHIHNREFEDMLNECKGDASCASLLSKGFWWLYSKPWRRCSESDPYACIPYHCAANQEGTTECKALQNNPIQALVDLDVRCWDKGRSMWQFMMTRDGCKDYLPWRGGTGVGEYLRIGYNCHGCQEGGCENGNPTCCLCADPDCRLHPVKVDHHERTCSVHWTECKPGSGFGSNGISKNWGGRGNAGQNDFLAGHVVQCPPNTYLSEWRVSRERCESGHLRIHYRCCERYWGPCRTLTTSGSTSEWADGLESHNVQCDPRTESLNHFEWTGSAFSYTCCCENACCNPAFEGSRDTATRPYWPHGKQYPIGAPAPYNGVMQRPDDGAWTTNPPDSPTYTQADSVAGGYARPPPDDPEWLRGKLNGYPGNGHNAQGVWKGDPMAQLASISEHLDGKHDKK